jgi:glycosyltransferase involved in cell wall biosynthesis
VTGTAPQRSDAAITPVAWRAAAVGVLVGGAAAGFLAGRRRLGRIVPLATAGVAIGCAVPVAVASRRPPISPESAAAALEAAATPPTFTVLVGARDEAGVLSQLVRDVARQDYRTASGEPLFELVVVDDRSKDASGDAVKGAARECGIENLTRVIRREGAGLPDGKGAALTAAQPSECRGDIVVVLDADARIEPWFLRRAAGYFAAGAAAVTARRRILDSGSSWLAGAQGDEQTLDGELNRGRWALGGCSEFRGNGIMIKRDLLAAAGGWKAAALTEDIDLSSRVAAIAGERVAWAIDTQVWEEPVRDWRGLWRQRLRWAEGGFRRAFEHGPAVILSRRLSAASRLDFIAYAGQLAVPAVAAGAAAAALATGRKRTLVAILAGYLGVSAGLAWDSLRWESDPDGRPLPRGERLRRALRVTFFNGLWLLVVPRALLNLALRGGPVRYEKMEHEGSAKTNWEPGDAAGRHGSPEPGGCAIARPAAIAR